MKKLVIALAFLGFSAGAMAQSTEVPTLKYSVATNSFWANWFVSVGGNFNAFYSEQEAPSVPTSPFIRARRDFGFDVAVGKWFTPGLGLRTKFQGIWAKQVDTRDYSPMRKYFNLHEDVLFNFSNLFCGYSETRVWNFIPYIGAGFGRNYSDNITSFTSNFGLLNTWKLNKRLLIQLDAYGVLYSNKNFDGAASNESHAWGSMRSFDKQFGVSVGLTFNLGKSTWEKVPDVAALAAMNKEQIDALNASLKEQQDENARLRAMLANKKPEVTTETKVVKEIAATTQSVFFNIGSSRIASRKDLVNVKEVAEYAKANNSKIIVTGYADSKTGSAAYNQKLSQRRCDVVVNELVKMGVNRDNIITEAKGGVNDLSPISYNRRATVKLQ